MPDCRGRARGHEGGVHEGDRLLRRARHHLRRPGASRFTEPSCCKRQLFEAWGERLGVTEDESDFACDQGWKALEIVDADLQKKGRAILETVEEENRVAVLMLGRPYHSDPG